MSTINRYLPVYDFSEYHSRKIKASRENVYAALQKVDFRESLFIRLLFFLRGLRSATFLEARKHFSVLLENPPEELVLGLIARPWKLKGDPIKTEPDLFISFQKSDCIKAVWNFDLKPIPEGTLLSTETRVLCLDEASKRKFRRYWFFVRPFSGLMRLEMLRLIAKHVEGQ